MVRLITCQQAALLLAKRHDHALSLAQRAGLCRHLHDCRYCSRHARPTALVAQLARHAALGPQRMGSRPVPAPQRQPRPQLAEAF